MYDLKDYIDAWLQGPASAGRVVVTFRSDDVRWLLGTWKTPTGVDILPLFKLRGAEIKFQFYMYSDKDQDAVIPKDGDKDIEDTIDCIELLRFRAPSAPLVVHLKPGYKQEDYVKARTKGPYCMGGLKEWIGNIWPNNDPGYDFVEAM